MNTAPPSMLRAAPRRVTSSAFTWPRAIAYGLLWAIASTAMETLSIPTEGLTSGEIVRSAFLIGIVWCEIGIGMACTAKLVGTRFELPAIAGLGVLTALLLSSIHNLVLYLANGPNIKVFHMTFSVRTNFFYVMWISIFYGGLFYMGCVFSIRADLRRSLLGQARIARGQSDALWAEAQLQSLQGHVDPSFLLLVMDEVGRRYAATPARADRLLDQLVSFLRAAMPGVRSGQSTLASEAELARSHMRLWSEMNPLRGRWHIRIDANLPTLPFPPLLLLPVIDELAAATPRSSACSVEITQPAESGIEGCPRAAALSLRGPIASGWLPAKLAHRLRVGLASVYGDDWALLVNEAPSAGDPALVITLSSPSPRGPAARNRVVSTTQEIHDE